MKGIEKLRLSFEYDKAFESEKWRKEIPWIRFPEKWEIKIIPPFTGAVVRFLVRYNAREISVYLDCYENLGYFGSPYWEMYPNLKDDVSRFNINDVNGLIKEIAKVLEKE